MTKISSRKIFFVTVAIALTMVTVALTSFQSGCEYSSVGYYGSFVEVDGLKIAYELVGEPEKPKLVFYSWLAYLIFGVRTCQF